MSGRNQSSESNSETSLRAWIGTVLFGTNLLMSVLGTAAIFRYGRMALKVFQDFEIELPVITQLTLSIPFTALLPFFGLSAIAVQILSKSDRQRLIFHTVHFLIIVMIISLFVGTVLPTMFRLTSELNGT